MKASENLSMRRSKGSGLPKELRDDSRTSKKNCPRSGKMRSTPTSEVRMAVRSSSIFGIGERKGNRIFHEVISRTAPSLMTARKALVYGGFLVIGKLTSSFPASVVRERYWC